MLDFLSGIGDMFLALWDYMLQTLEELWAMIQILGNVVAQIPSYFSWLPGAIVEIIGATLAVAVLYKVLGRDG